jgi:hypothetical protein
MESKAEWSPFVGDKLKALYLKALDRWGPDLQVDMAVEEMAELTQALVKARRSGIPPTEKARAAVAEEMADVEIMLEQLRLIFRNETSVEMARARKLARLERRLEC